MTPAEKEAFEEWSVLKKVSNEAAQYCEDWESGVNFISTLHMKAYVKKLVEENCFLEGVPSYLVSATDWDKAVEEFKEDWTPIDWDGVEFWVQNCC